MRSVVLLVVLLPLALSGAPALSAPSAAKPAITGFPPYLLGTESQAVIRTDPELSPGNYPLWTRDLLTQNYGRSIVAPLGGANYIAVLGVQFWQGRLAVVILKWPAKAFESASAWRHAAESLYKSITANYAHEAVKQRVVTSGPTWTVDLADREKNMLSAWSIDRPYEITVVYLWGPYAKALESARTPVGSY